MLYATAMGQIMDVFIRENAEKLDRKTDRMKHK